MKFSAVCLLALVFVAAGDAGANKQLEHPIVKVISLLKSLIAEAEKEGTEEKLAYEKYVYNCGVNKKTLNDAISDEAELIEELSDTIDAKTKEIAVLTSDLEDLEGQFAANAASIAKQDAARKDTNKLYEKTKAELEATLTAIQAALKALEGAETKTESGLAQAKATVKKAVALIQLWGKELPTGYLDDHIDKYDFKSESIIEMLKKLESDFQDKLVATIAAETNSVNGHQLSMNNLDAMQEQQSIFKKHDSDLDGHLSRKEVAEKAAAEKAFADKEAAAKAAVENAAAEKTAAEKAAAEKAAAEKKAADEEIAKARAETAAVAKALADKEAAAKAAAENAAAEKAATEKALAEKKQDALNACVKEFPVKKLAKLARLLKDVDTCKVTAGILALAKQNSEASQTLAENESPVSATTEGALAELQSALHEHQKETLETLSNFRSQIEGVQRKQDLLVFGDSDPLESFAAANRMPASSGSAVDCPRFSALRSRVPKSRATNITVDSPNVQLPEDSQHEESSGHLVGEQLGGSPDGQSHSASSSSQAAMATSSDLNEAVQEVSSASSNSLPSKIVNASDQKPRNIKRSHMRLHMILEIDGFLLDTLPWSRGKDADASKLKERELNEVLRVEKGGTPIRVKFRPHARWFFKELINLYEFSIFSKEPKKHTHEMVKYLDPTNEFIDRKVVRCQENESVTGPVHVSYMIKRGFPAQQVLILEKDTNLWSSVSKAHPDVALLRVSPYTYIEDGKAEGRLLDDRDVHLLYLARFCVQLHAAVFSSPPPSTKPAMSSMWRKTLKDVKLCALVRPQSLIPRAAKQFGASLEKTVHAGLHLVVVEDRKHESIKLAHQLRVPLVDTKWLNLCMATFTLQDPTPFILSKGWARSMWEGLDPQIGKPGVETPTGEKVMLQLEKMRVKRVSSGQQEEPTPSDVPSFGITTIEARSEVGSPSEIS